MSKVGGEVVLRVERRKKICSWLFLTVVVGVISLRAEAESRPAKRAPSAEGAKSKDTLESSRDSKIGTARVTLSRKLRLLAAPEFFFIKGATQSLSGVGATVGGIFGIRPNWGFGLGVRQGFAVSGGLSSAFTQLDGRVVWSPNGSLIQQSQTWISGDKERNESRQATVGGIRAQFSITQYLFYGSTISAYTGAGLAVEYELPSVSDVSFLFGARGEFLSGSSTLFPVQMYFGVLLWL